MTETIGVMLVLAACGLLDRIRGGWWPTDARPELAGRVAGYLAMTLFAGLLLPTWPLVLAGGALMGAWNIWPIRHDAGWQGDWVRHRGDTFAQPLEWGAVWCLPLVGMAWWHRDAAVILLAAPLGALTSIRLAVFVREWGPFDSWNPWPLNELMRLPIIGAIALGLQAVVDP